MKDAQDDDPVSDEEEGAPAVDEMDALLQQMRQLRADIEHSSTSVGQRFLILHSFNVNRRALFEEFRHSVSRFSLTFIPRTVAFTATSRVGSA